MLTVQTQAQAVKAMTSWPVHTMSAVQLLGGLELDQPKYINELSLGQG